MNLCNNTERSGVNGIWRKKRRKISRKWALPILTAMGEA
jgi:hypothetical protein